MTGRPAPRFTVRGRALVVGLLLIFPRGLLPMGTEKFGSEPAVEQEDWPPGLLPVLNLHERFYARWINGNESFYYLGKTDRLNEALKLFAGVASEGKEVVIRPGPGRTHTFDGASLPCDWEVHVPSGIYLHLARKENGTRVLRRHPSLIVYVSPGRIELEKLQVPAGLTVSGLPDLLGRFLAGLRNPDVQVRGQAAYLLGTEHAHAATRVVPALVPLLADPSEYVRLSVEGALERFGEGARPALPALREALPGKGEAEQKAIEKAMAAIEGRKEGEPDLEEIQGRIDEYLKTLRPRGRG